MTLGLLGAVASAHERRVVGRYELTVGWRDEPAIANVPNAVSVQVREATSGHAVDGLHALTVEVTFGGLQRAARLDLQPVGAAHPGDYAATIIPTRSGDYVFRIRGDVQGESIDERFESGPGRFDSVRPPSDVAYPDAPDLAALSTDLSRTQIIAYVALGIAVLTAALLVMTLARNRRRT